MSDWLDELSQREAAAEPTWRRCWRCNRTIDGAALQCPHCAAPAGTVADESRRERAEATRADTQTLLRMLGVYGASLAVLVVGHFALLAEEGHKQGVSFQATVVLEAIDAAITLFALLWIPVRFRPERRPFGQRILDWAGFTVLLGGVWFLNLGYHCLLRDFLQLDWIDLPGLDQRPVAAWLAVICIEPAIVEELFFRYVAQGVLRSIVPMHPAVLITAAMFALAHSAVPLSMPILFLLGLLLGYARAVSGSLLLPIALHFLHNLAVLALELHWRIV